MADIGRQTGGSATRFRKHPVARRGIPGHVERVERSIRRRLATAEVGTRPDPITYEVRQVSLDNGFRGDASKSNDHRVILTPENIAVGDEAQMSSAGVIRDL